MSIKTRLNKLQSRIIGNDSGVCACYPQKRFEVWYADLSEDSESSEPEINGEPLPDICPNCRKTVEKNKIIVQFCDGTTPTRFPKEWNERGK